MADKDLLTKLVFPLAVVFVFLVLAVQYESWSLPLAILLIVPMCLLAAIAGVWLMGMDNNIFTQIGLVVLIALAAKNAILIVEFAKQLQDQGKERIEATIEASKMRLRPILMTAFSFILGVVPLVLCRGRGPRCAWRLALRCSAECWGLRCSASSTRRCFMSSSAGSRSGRRRRPPRRGRTPCR